MTLHVIGRVTFPTSHALSHSGSPVEPVGDDGSHGDDLCALLRHKQAVSAFPRIDSPSHEKRNVGNVQGTVVDDEGFPLLSSA